MGALLPLILTLAPEIALWLFGPKGDAVRSAVAQAVTQITGASDDISSATILHDDQAKQDALRVHLAQIVGSAKLAADLDAQAQRAADMQALREQIADIQNARRQMGFLAQVGSSTVWGAMVVSLVVLVVFATTMWLAFHAAAGSEGPVQVGLIEVVKATSVSVVSFWVGSSFSSQRKDSTIADAQKLLAAAPPPST